MNVARTLLTVLAVGFLAVMVNCGGHLYDRKKPPPSDRGAAANRIDKFNLNYVCCRAKDEFEKEGFNPDFKKNYFIQAGKNLVNTMFSALHDSSKNLMMIEVIGNQNTFPLSLPFMEKTAYIRDIVSSMQQYYHFSEDSAVSIISSFNGRRPMPCPVVSLPACEFIAKNLLQSVIKEANPGEGE